MYSVFFHYYQIFIIVFTAMLDGCLYYFPIGLIHRTIYSIDDLHATS